MRYPGLSYWVECSKSWLALLLPHTTFCAQSFLEDLDVDIYLSTSVFTGRATRQLEYSTRVADKIVCSSSLYGKCSEVSSRSAESSYIICPHRLLLFLLLDTWTMDIYIIVMSISIFTGLATRRLKDKMTVWSSNWTEMFCSGWLHHWLRLKEYSSLVGWLLSMIPESLFLKKWNSLRFQTDHRIGGGLWSRERIKKPEKENILQKFLCCCLNFELEDIV